MAQRALLLAQFPPKVHVNLVHICVEVSHYSCNFATAKLAKIGEIRGIILVETAWDGQRNCAIQPR